jgi:hypothetical protein
MSSESIEVVVVSLEEAEAQIAEFWIGGVFFGHTLPGSAELVLRIEPRTGGTAWEVSFHELRRSLDRAAELLRVDMRTVDPTET